MKEESYNDLRDNLGLFERPEKKGDKASHQNDQNCIEQYHTEVDI